VEVMVPLACMMALLPVVESVPVSALLSAHCAPLPLPLESSRLCG
jgi:hypothetical protein